MTRVLFQIEAEVDEEVLAEHIAESGGAQPPYNGSDEWDYLSDLAAAARVGVLPDDSPIVGWSVVEEHGE